MKPQMKVYSNFQHQKTLLIKLKFLGYAFTDVQRLEIVKL